MNNSISFISEKLSVDISIVIHEEKHFLLELKDEKSSINLDDFSLENIKNIISALKFINKEEANISYYRLINGLYFLQLFNKYKKEIFERMKQEERFESQRRFDYILSKIIMDYFGHYDTFFMISKGLLLDYTEPLTIGIDMGDNFTYYRQRFPNKLLEQCKGSLNVKKLEIYHRKIRSVDFCAETLEDLTATYKSGLNQRGIQNCKRLLTLNISQNGLIRDFRFCAETLTSLDISGIENSLKNDNLRPLINLRKLNISRTKKILV